MERCIGCSENWFIANTLQSWYNNYNLWVKSGECPFARGGIKPFVKIVEPEIFNACLEEYFETD